MKCLIITQPGHVEEMNLSGREPYLVLPVATPPLYAIADTLPPIVEAYPTIMLRRHIIRRGEPGPMARPHPLDEEYVCYWPDSWRDEWALTEFNRWRTT